MIKLKKINLHIFQVVCVWRVGMVGGSIGSGKLLLVWGIIFICPFPFLVLRRFAFFVCTELNINPPSLPPSLPPFFQELDDLDLAEGEEKTWPEVLRICNLC